MLRTAIVLLTELTIILALSVSPAPIVNPDGITWDPNDAPSPVMGAYQGYVGTTITGEVDIYVETGTIRVGSTHTTIGTPTADPNGTLFTYPWSFTSTTAGLVFDSWTVTDDMDTVIDERTIVFNAVRKAVITGCRRADQIN